MSITRTPALAVEATRLANLGRATRRLFAVVSRSVSSAAERLVARSGETPSEYYRFPWF
jgi:hypothetical protein